MVNGGCRTRMSEMSSQKKKGGRGQRERSESQISQRAGKQFLPEVARTSLFQWSPPAPLRPPPRWQLAPAVVVLVVLVVVVVVVVVVGYVDTHVDTCVALITPYYPHIASISI